MNEELFNRAIELARQGVSIIATNAAKKPASVEGKMLEWNPFKERIANENELQMMFKEDATGIATIGGAVSGGLEIIDFDYHYPNAGIDGRFIGNVYPDWAELVKVQYPDLFQRLVINSTPTGGNHVRYRYKAEIYEGKKSLANAYNQDADGKILLRDGKPEIVTIIEQRGERAYALCPPSPNYQMIQGDLLAIPTITKEERDFLIQTAKSFHVISPNDKQPAQDVGLSPTITTTQPSDELRPGDDYNQRGDHRGLLEKHGWTFVTERKDGAELWRRPGKDDNGWSATWNAIPNRFYVFSTNASPLDAERTYDLFSLYACLEEHNGDFGAAAKALAREGYGTQKQSTHIPTEGIVSRHRTQPSTKSIPHENNKSEQANPSAGVVVSNFPEILFTDGWNAKRFVREHGGDVRYCYEWGKWLTYDGKRWIIDNTGEVVRRAKQTIKRLYAQAAETDNDIERKLLADHAKKSDSNYKYKAMLGLIECEIPILNKELDVDPMLFNVENGTLDLRTGELKGHRREDFISKLAPVNYDVNASCPKWLSFLERIMDNNTNLIDFLQRAVGYALTSDVGEQALFFLYGTGANGKTVFLETIKGMLGDYAKEAEPEILIQKHNEAHPTGVADLLGARFVATTEVGEGRRMNETKVKQLTGGDRLKARFMRQDFFEFYPTHKIFLAANHKPIIKGTDYAIWRRIKLVPFEITIPEKERIPFVKMLATLKAEWPGILAWAVQGCIKWQTQGLGTPTEVTRATQAYRKEMDIVGDFLEEHCIIDVNAKAKASTLYATYKIWCDTNGEHALTQKVFGSRLTERGLERKREKTGYFWLGIGILENLVNDPNNGSSAKKPNGSVGFNEYEGEKVNHDEPLVQGNENSFISPRVIQKNGSPSFTQSSDDNHKASSSKGLDEVNDRSSSDEREVFVI